MDHQPKPDAAQNLPGFKSDQDPDPNPAPDTGTGDARREASPNGDADKGTPSMGSDSTAESDPSEGKSLQAPSRSGSGGKSVHWRPDSVAESRGYVNSDDSNKVDLDGSNPYVTSSPAPSSSSFSFKETMGTVRDVLGRWGKKVEEATRKAEDLAGNAWQHLKTSPSFADAALGRIAQGTKVLAEGGYEKIFRQTFETVPEELLQNSYACYLSTSAGPVMGILYVSTAKLAFCSDNPLSYKSGDQTEWSYYKVVIPLHQLKAVNPSSSRTNSSEKYIQVISVDNHEFWFMGFLNYDGAVKCLQDSSQTHDFQNA